MNCKFFVLFFILILFLSVAKAIEEAGEQAHLFVSVYKVNLRMKLEGRFCPQYRPKYCPGDVVHINNTLENAGNMNVTGNLSTKILDSENQPIFSFDWNNTKILVNESKSFLTNYSIQIDDENGTYTVISNFTYPQNSTQVECPIIVNKGIGTLKASPSEIKDEIRAGNSKEYTLLIWLEDACNTSLARLNASAKPLEVSFSYPEVLLAFSNKTNVTINVPSSVPPGIYDKGNITIKADNQEIVIPLNITVLGIGVTTVPEVGAPARRIPVITPIRAISLRLSTTVLTATLGNTTSFIAYVNNTGNEEVKAVKISIEGIFSDWISITPSIANIKPGDVQEYLVTIRIPKSARTGIYRLKIKATDLVESNEETLVLVIGENYKQIADLLLEELEDIKEEASRTLLIKKCIDVTVIESIFNDAELALENGKSAYENGDYEKSIDWFEYALSTYKKVLSKADILIKMELETSKKSKFLIPPFFDAEEQFNLAENYLKEKNYEKICEPIEKIRRYIMSGLIFWPLTLILFVAVIGLIIALHRKKKRFVSWKTIKEIKKRKIFEE